MEVIPQYLGEHLELIWERLFFTSSILISFRTIFDLGINVFFANTEWMYLMHTLRDKSENPVSVTIKVLAKWLRISEDNNLSPKSDWGDSGIVGLIFDFGWVSNLSICGFFEICLLGWSETAFIQVTILFIFIPVPSWTRVSRSMISHISFLGQWNKLTIIPRNFRSFEKKSLNRCHLTMNKLKNELNLKMNLT